MTMFHVDKLTTLLGGPFSFSLEAKSITSLQGPSGNGKTLLLRALADLDPHQGHIYFQATEQQQITAHQWRKNITYMPTESLWWFETVAEHFAKPEQLPLAELGLEQKILQQFIHDLSSGQKQRLSLLRALEHQPQVLLLDEPTAHLDPHHKILLEKFITQYAQQHQAAVLWVSHDHQSLSKVAQKHLLLTSTHELIERDQL